MLSMFVVLISISCASAASTIYVNTTGNDTTGDGSAENPFLTIQKGVGNVTDGDTLIIAMGQYEGTDNTNITIDKNLTIIGESQECTIINGNGTSQIFRVNPGVSLILRNLTLTNGNSTSGGAIYNMGTLEVENCTFTSNTQSGYEGGGAIFTRGNCTVIGSNFTGNIATALGGAIYNDEGKLTILSSNFSNNTAWRAGAICTEDILIAEACIFTNNTATNSTEGFESLGGAIVSETYLENTTLNDCIFIGNTANRGGAIWNLGPLTINNSTLINNTASRGGAIMNSNRLTTNNCTFMGNTASGDGGAIQNYNTMAANECTFTANTAVGDGGAIITMSRNLTVINCIFTGNMAGGDGGAIITNMSRNLTVINCIFKDNTAVNGGAINNNGTCTMTGSTFDGNIAYCGGAIFNWNYCAVNESIFNNNAAVDGSAIYNFGNLTATTCNFQDNIYKGTGGGISGAAIFSYNYGTPSYLNVKYSRFVGNTGAESTQSDIYLWSSGPVANTLIAQYNWWGSNDGPAEGRINGDIYNPILPTMYESWLVMTINATPTTINNTQTSLITVSFNNLFDGTNVIPFDPSEGHVPDMTPVDFSLIAGWLWPNGSLSSLSAFTFDGIASVLFTASSAGVQDINATTDNQTVSTHVNIDPAAYLTISKEFRDAPWGNVITTAYYNQKIYALVKVRNSGPDSSSFSVLDILSGLNWTGNYYVLSAVGSILPTPESWVLNDPYNTFNGTHWTVPNLSTMIGSSRWLAIECIVKAVGVVSNEAQTVNQTAYAYAGFASYKANLTTVPTPTKTFTLSVKNTGTGRIKAVYYVTVYRPDNAAPIFKKYVFYLNPGKSTSFTVGTYAVGTAISTDELVYNFAYSMKTVSLVNTWSATGLVPYVQNYVVAKVPASRSKGAIARKRFWINPAALGVQIVVPPKLM